LADPLLGNRSGEQPVEGGGARSAPGAAAPADHDLVEGEVEKAASEPARGRPVLETRAGGTTTGAHAQRDGIQRCSRLSGRRMVFSRCGATDTIPTSQPVSSSMRRT